jgi:hypothetical protein
MLTPQSPVYLKCYLTHFQLWLLMASVLMSSAFASGLLQFPSPSVASPHPFFTERSYRLVSFSLLAIYPFFTERSYSATDTSVLSHPWGWSLVANSEK